MNPTPKLSLLLLLFALFVCMIIVGIWTIDRRHLNAQQLNVDRLKAKLTRQKRQAQDDFRSHIKRTGNDWKKVEDEWDNRQKTHRINIEMTDLEADEQQEQQKDLKVKEALMKMMMKLKETNKAAPDKRQRHIHNAPGLDFRREFASDEPNPYVENMRNRCEQPKLQ